MQELFRKFATKVSNFSGSSYTFIAAIMLVITWWASGPMFQYSNTWQLVINTGTTIVTFLMVFLIQNTQNRDGRAIQIKLDELLRATKGARQSFVNMEELSDEELAMLQTEFQELRQKTSSKMLSTLHEKIILERQRREVLKPFDTAFKSAVKGISKLEKDVVKKVSPKSPARTKKTNKITSSSRLRKSS